MLKTVQWMREDYLDSVEQNALMLKAEIGYASQRAIIENIESLDEAKPRKSLLEKIRGGSD